MSPEAPKSPYRDAPLRAERRPPSGAIWIALTTLLLGSVGALVRWQTRPLAFAPAARPPAFRSIDRTEAWIASVTPDGAWAIVRDGARLLVRRGARTAERAPVSFASRIVAATPTAHGWVFVAEDGSVALADSFLGTPRDLGHLPCATRIDRGGRGIATAVDVDGGLFTTDGSGPFARATTPGLVRAAVFLSRDLGAVILRDGGLAVTHDGGQRWRALDLRGDVAWAFTRTPRCVEVETLTRVHCLDAHGRLTDGAAREAAETWPEGVAEPVADEGQRFRAATLARCVDPGDPLPTPPGPRFACRATPTIEPLALTLDPTGGSACDRRRVRGAAHAVHGDVAAGGAVSAGRATAFAMWRLADRPDVWSTRSWMGFADLVAPFAHGCDATVTAVAATRAGVLLYNAGLQRLVWGARDGGFTRVPEPLCDAARNAPLTGATLSIALPDGGALVLLDREVYRGGPSGTWDTTAGIVPWRETVGVAFDLSPLGVVRARRPGAFQRHTVGLARRGNERGFVLHDGATLTLYPIGGGAPVALPALASTCVASCRGDDPSRWTVALPRGCATLDLGRERASVGAVELALGPTEACVRALNAVQGDAPVSLVARDGRLEGTRAGRERITCTPTAALP